LIAESVSNPDSLPFRSAKLNKKLSGLNRNSFGCFGNDRDNDIQQALVISVRRNDQCRAHLPG